MAVLTGHILCWGYTHILSQHWESERQNRAKQDTRPIILERTHHFLSSAEPCTPARACPPRSLSCGKGSIRGMPWGTKTSLRESWSAWLLLIWGEVVKNRKEGKSTPCILLIEKRECVLWLSSQMNSIFSVLWGPRAFNSFLAITPKYDGICKDRFPYLLFLSIFERKILWCLFAMQRLFVHTG